MIVDNIDIKYIIDRDQEDLEWVEDNHTKHRDTHEPLYLKYEERRDIQVWRQNEGQAYCTSIALYANVLRCQNIGMQHH